MPVTSDDPLDEALRPPPDETPAERDLRLEREAEAKRISLAIDASIKAERQARRKKRIVRLLLLGQSESGARFFLLLLLIRMNEPHDVPDINAWATSVQAAVTAIRNAGSVFILFPCYEQGPLNVSI